MKDGLITFLSVGIIVLTIALFATKNSYSGSIYELNQIGLVEISAGVLVYTPGDDYWDTDELSYLTTLSQAYDIIIMNP